MSYRPPTAPSCRMPSSSVRPPRPTKSVSPIFSTSPPSSVPGGSMRCRSSPSSCTAVSPAATSARREVAPGRVSTAARPAMTTTVSSTKTESGQSSAAVTSIVSQPLPARVATYVSHWRAARPASTGRRSMCVTSPSPSRGPGRRTRARGLTSHSVPSGDGDHAVRGAATGDWCNMRALIYDGPGKRTWREAPDPTILEPTDAIVGVDTTTICGTDLHILKGDVPEVTTGRILGHEAVGTVEAVGSAVTTIRPGDRVLVSCISACGRCRFCRNRMYGQCVGGGGWILGHKIDGTQAEYVRVPFADTSTYVVPPGVEDEAVLM